MQTVPALFYIMLAAFHVFFSTVLQVTKRVDLHFFPVVSQVDFGNLLRDGQIGFKKKNPATT